MGKYTTNIYHTLQSSTSSVVIVMFFWVWACLVIYVVAPDSLTAPSSYYIPKSLKRRYVWPIGSARLPALSRFRSTDHLKGRGEGTGKGATPVVTGGAEDNDRATAVDAGGGRNGEASAVSTSTSTSTSTPSLSRHADRVRDIVEEATGVSRGAGGGGSGEEIRLRCPLFSSILDRYPVV